MSWDGVAEDEEFKPLTKYQDIENNNFLRSYSEEDVRSAVMGFYEFMKHDYQEISSDFKNGWITKEESAFRKDEISHWKNQIEKWFPVFFEEDESGGEE